VTAVTCEHGDDFCLSLGINKSILEFHTIF